MDINRANMATLFTSYNQSFRDGFALGSTQYQGMVTEIPNATALIEFPFLEQFGGMREWLGPRQVKNVASQKLQVRNRTFEDTVAVPVNDIEDDQYGIYAPIIGEMGMGAGNLWGDLFVEALVTNDSWLDGVAFFSAAGRAYDGSNAVANYGTSALSETTYATAYKAMMGYLGHGGKPLRIVPDTLVVGPKLMDTAKKIVELPATLTSGLTGESTYVNWTSAPNPWYNSAKLVVLPELVGTYDDYWFLMCTKRMVKPVLLSKRQTPKLIAKNQLTDDNVFFEDKAIYGTKGRGEAALSLPHLIYGNYVA